MLYDLLLANRSYRSFDPAHPVPHDLLVSAVAAARICPSSANVQPLVFRAVEGAEDCARMLPLTAWAGKLPGRCIPPEGHAPTAYLIICQDTAVSDHPTRFDRDVGIAAQTILLTAAEAGYGGCMIGSFRADDVLRMFLPGDRYLPKLVIALGRPDEKVTLVDLAPDGDSSYYRDAEGRHFVPKRRLEDLMI